MNVSVMFFICVLQSRTRIISPFMLSAKIKPDTNWAGEKYLKPEYKLLQWSYALSLCGSRQMIYNCEPLFVPVAESVTLSPKQRQNDQEQFFQPERFTHAHSVCAWPTSDSHSTPICSLWSGCTRTCCSCNVTVSLPGCRRLIEVATVDAMEGRNFFVLALVLVSLIYQGSTSFRRVWWKSEWENFDLNLKLNSYRLKVKLKVGFC